MKIALLLTGQLRTFHMCKHLVKNVLLDKHDVDVFLSIDMTNQFQTENLNTLSNSSIEDVQEALDFYDPVNVFINTEYDSEFSKFEFPPSLLQRFPLHSLRLLYQQYFIVHQAYLLLQQHLSSQQNPPHYYDIILRLRFDQFFWNDSDHRYLLAVERNKENQIRYNTNNIEILKEKSKLSKLQLDKPVGKKVYVLGFGCHSGYYPFVNDQFFIHSQETYPLFQDFYEELIDIIMEALSSPPFPDKGCYFEHFFYRFLQRNQLEYHKSIINGMFIRQQYS